MILYHFDAIKRNQNNKNDYHHINLIRQKEFYFFSIYYQLTLRFSIIQNFKINGTRTLSSKVKESRIK